jgi:hypothetical protein
MLAFCESTIAAPACRAGAFSLGHLTNRFRLAVAAFYRAFSTTAGWVSSPWLFSLCIPAFNREVQLTNRAGGLTNVVGD